MFFIIKPGPGGHPTGTRGYRTAADRRRAIKMLTRKGFNYFVCFHDVKSRYALYGSNAAWVKPGQVHVNW